MLKRFLLQLVVCAAVLMMWPASGESSPFTTAAEKEAFADFSNGHFIKARQKAEKLLEADPNSIAANYVMGLVFWEGEGNLLRAMVLLKKTIGLFEERYCSNETGVPASTDEVIWHQRMMRELARIYNELDDREAEIAQRERIAELYHTTLDIEAVWGLMKLHRYDEATKIARDVIENNNSETYWLDMAYNDLTAIADAQNKHMESYKESLRSVAYHAGKSCVVLSNHARSLTVMLRFEEAIEELQKARNAQDQDCVSNPLDSLSKIYLLGGKWQNAISAMLKLRKIVVEPRLYEQTEADTRAATAMLYHAMGFSEKAWTLYKTVIEAPGRLGFDSIRKEQKDMSSRIMYSAISADYLKRLDEHIGAWTAHSFTHYFDGLLKLDFLGLLASDERKRVYELMETRDMVRRRMWSVNQQIYKDALAVDTVKSLLVPTYILWPQYYYAAADTLGRRTAEYMVQFQEESLTDEEHKIMMPIFDHFKAYISWRDGEDDKALEYIDKYRAGSKPYMTLLDEQARLMRADILERRQNYEEAYDEMLKVYGNYPSAFRHFDVKMPVEFNADLVNSEDGELEDVLDMLRSSPRFAETDNHAPFVISADRVDDAEQQGKIIQICLDSRLGQRYACSSILKKDYDSAPDSGIALPDIVDNFYHRMLTPKVDLSQSDLHSLDGSPVQISADKALEKLMKTSDSVLGDVFNEKK